MAWNSFLKNLIGGEANAATVLDNTPDNSTARNENLTGRAFKKQLEETPNAVLLDVRTLGKFSGGTIPGSLNMEFFSPGFANKVKQLDQEPTYFLFCRSGNRSGQACKMMHQLGFDVRNLSGGIGAYPG